MPNRQKKPRGNSKKMITRVTLDLSSSEYAILQEVTEKGGHHSMAECARVALKFYAKMTDIIQSNNGLYVGTGDKYERIHLLF